MSISYAVAPHIPFLRRFARALSGTQTGGDAYVAAALEAILADPDCLDVELDPKIALYKLFLRGWRNVPANNHVDGPTFGDEASANRNLSAISTEPRIAFLLSTRPPGGGGIPPNRRLESQPPHSSRTASSRNGCDNQHFRRPL